MVAVFTSLPLECRKPRDRLVTKLLRWTMIFALAPILAQAAANPAALWEHYRRNEVFALRAELPAASEGETPDIRFLRAASLAASGRPAESAALLSVVIERSREARLVAQARELLMLDRRALFQYRAALAAIEPLLRAPSATGMVGLANRARLLRALADAPAQSARAGDGSPISLDDGGEIRATLNGQRVLMQLDSGANLSAITRSAARRLGLVVRRADYVVGSSVGGTLRADAALADLSFADGSGVKNVLFLVLPDSALAQGGGRLAGLIGLPVIQALGSIEFDRGAVRFGAQAPNDSRGTPMALSGGDPLVEIRYSGRSLACRLDTGANRTVFYAPFLREFPGAVARGRSFRARIEGTAGARRFAASRAYSLTFELAGGSVALANVVVLDAPTSGAQRNLYCNIGRDALRRLGHWRADFRRMTFSAPHKFR